MANVTPFKGRMAKKRKNKPGDLPTLQRTLWAAVMLAADVANEAGTGDATLKALHCLSQLSGQYAKLLEIGELEARLAALEQALQAGNR